MLRDASQRASAAEASALALRCDAPQHEDAGAKHQLAAVRNNRRGSVIVSGLLFTMTFATPTCRPRHTLKIMQGNTRADVPLSRRHIRTARLSHGALPSCRAACVGAPVARRANRAGRIKRCSSSEPWAVRFTPAESCEEFAPRLRCHRNHLKTVARSRFASRPGAWLRLSRPTQSLMTLA
jgi:hypothetical protein